MSRPEKPVATIRAVIGFSLEIRLDYSLQLIKALLFLSIIITTKATITTTTTVTITTTSIGASAAVNLRVALTAVD